MKTKYLRSLFSPDIFKAIFYVVSIAGVCPLVGPTIAPCLKLFHVYAVAVIVLDLLGEQRILRNKGRTLLVVFGFCYIATLLNNRNLLTFSGLSNFCYLLAELGIVYSYGKHSRENDKISGAIICTLITGCNLVGIWMFFTKFCLYIPERGYIGIYPHENRLAGLFGNPNVLGMICLGAICLSCILFYSSKKNIGKVYFAVLGGINVVTLLLSNSRTQMYSVLFFVLIFVFMRVLKNRRNMKGACIAAAAAIISVLLVFGSFKTIQWGLSKVDFNYAYYLQNISKNHAQLSTEPDATQTGETDETISDVTEPDNINNTDETTDDSSDPKHEPTQNVQSINRQESSGFNGRLDLWLSGIKIIVAKPVFGCGLDNHNYTLYMMGQPELPVKGNLHNVYLDILACFGIAGFGCLAVFLLIMFGNVINFFKYNDGNTWTLGSVLLACVAAFMLDGVADSTLIASLYPTAVSFWYIASQFANLLEEENLRTNHYRRDFLYTVADSLKKRKKR